MERILVALDVDTAEEARAIAARLRGVVGGFKVGSRLFTAHGPAIVEELVSQGDRVFLDLKFHDIPSTVAGAIAAATRLGVWMVNVHASGGSAMMRAAREAADREAARAKRAAPLVIGVTMLTSLSDHMLGEIGLGGRLDEQVARLAELANASGLQGVVASPQEVSSIRRRCGDQFVVVTPGIREGIGGARAQDDQSRTMSASAAIAAGASYLVVGRPIVAAPDPRAAAERMAAECRAGLRS